MADRVQNAIEALCSAARALPDRDAPLQQMLSLGVERGKYDATLTIRENLATAVSFLDPFRDGAWNQSLSEIPRPIADSLVNEIEMLRKIAEEIVVRCQRQTTGVVPPSYHGAEPGVARQVEDIHARVYKRLAPLRHRPHSNLAVLNASTTPEKVSVVETAPVVSPPSPVAGAFFSYVRFNDEHDDGRLSKLCEWLEGEVRAQTGDPFAIWQDRRSIGWGEQWRQRIEEGLQAATLLIVVITPSWFKSSACREEFNRFLDLERVRGRADLVLPIVYIDTPALRDSNDPIAVEFRRRQLFHIDDLRNRKWINANIGRRIEEMAVEIRGILQRIVSEAEHARPAGKPEQTEPTETYPLATPIPGQPGFVRSPYSPEKITDVRSYAPFTAVRDPYTGFIFSVPDSRTIQPKIAPGLPADPLNRGWVTGWGVYRLAPWHLFAVCASRAEAEATKEDAGNEYVAAYGSHRVGSDDFIESSSQR